MQARFLRYPRTYNSKRKARETLLINPGNSPDKADAKTVARVSAAWQSVELGKNQTLRKPLAPRADESRTRGLFACTAYYTVWSLTEALTSSRSLHPRLN